MTTTDLAAGQDRDRALEAMAAALGRNLVSARRFHSEATGQGFTTGHEVELESADGLRETHVVYVESSPRRTDYPGVLLLRDESSDATMALWLYPADPRLPALASAVFPSAAAVLLQRLGLDSADIELEVVAYRPGKRAVVRISTAAGILFLKVVRSEAAALIRRRHELWLECGVPVPGVLASSDGIIALDRLPGVEAVTLVPALADGDGFLDALDELIARIAIVPSESPARPSLIARLDWYFGHLLAMSPSNTTELEALKISIELLYPSGGTAPLVTIHGDLHLAQLFVNAQRPNEIVGILDIDTAGLGDPADDAAALVAHLLVTAEYRDAAGEHHFAEVNRGLAERARQRWSRAGDAGFAARATAIAMTHLCGHALSGSVSVARAIELSHRLLTSHEDENPLTTGYQSSHEPPEG